MTMYEKIAAMKPEQRNHWIDIPELSYWGERFFAEFAVAEALAEPEEKALLERVIDALYEDFTRCHALTDDTCRRGEAGLLPFSQRAKAYRLHCVAHAHMDMDWMWGFHETVDVVLSTVRTMLDLMEEYPEFTFSQSQCAVYQIVAFYDPALFRRLKERVAQGRWEFAGSTWVEPDRNMPNLESMARQILYTRKFLREQLDLPESYVNLDFQPDAFGHSASVPDVLSAAGIPYFYHCRGIDGPYLYRWQGTSGAEVLALNEPLWYNDFIRPMYLSQVPKFCRRYGILDMMKVYGVGDHGGGPTRKDVERILDMQTWPVAPTIFFSTYHRYFAAIEDCREGLPLVRGELGPTFTGCYTSQSKLKLANRVAEDRLQEAEALAAFAEKEAGLPSYNAQFRFAWEKVLFNQFHDILPGSNVPASREHALGGFEDAMGSVMAASGAALRAFSEAIDTSAFDTPFDPAVSRSEGGGAGLGVDHAHHYRLPGVERGRGKTRLLHFFNPTPYPRSGVLDAVLWDWYGDDRRLRAFDAEGKPLTCHGVTAPGMDWNHQRTDVQVVTTVPAFGYTTVRLTEGEKEGFQFCELPPDPRETYYEPLVLENELVRVEFDETDLSIKRYVNKATGENLLGPGGGRFILYRERPGKRGGCAWVEGVHMDPRDLHRTGRAELTQAALTDPLRRSLSYTLGFGSSSLQVRAVLDAESPILELEVTARLMELADKAGSPKLSFRAELCWTPEGFLSDGQTGPMNRAPEPMHDWCSRDFYLACREAEPGLALVTDSKYGFRGYENRVETSLLRASSRPDPCPELGDRQFRLGLALCPDPETAKRLGSRFAHRDLPYVSNFAHSGKLPLTGTFLEVSPGALATFVKPAEDGNGWILRLVGKETGPVTVHAPGLCRARRTNLTEYPLEELPVENQVLTLTLTPGEIATVQLLFSCN